MKSGNQFPPNLGISHHQLQVYLLLSRGRLFASTYSDLYEYVDHSWKALTTENYPQLSGLCLLQQGIALLNNYRTNTFELYSLDTAQVTAIDLPQDRVGNVQRIACDPAGNLILFADFNTWRFDGISAIEKTDFGLFSGEGYEQFLFEAYGHTSYSKIKGGLPPISVSSVLVSSDNKLWIGGDNSVASYDTNGWTTYTYRQPKPNNFADIVEDKHGILFRIASDNGVFLWVWNSLGVVYYSRRFAI